MSFVETVAKAFKKGFDEKEDVLEGIGSVLTDPAVRRGVISGPASVLEVVAKDLHDIAEYMVCDSDLSEASASGIDVSEADLIAALATKMGVDSVGLSNYLKSFPKSSAVNEDDVATKGDEVPYADVKSSLGEENASQTGIETEVAIDDL